MRADIEPGPVEDRLGHARRFQRQVGASGRAGEHQQAEADRRNRAPPGSTAVHDADISSASMAAACFITAIMPARIIQEMRPIDPAYRALPLLRATARSREHTIHSRDLLQIIRNYNKEGG